MADALPTCLLDGAFIPTNEARISPLDRGFLFGDGVYEVIPCYAGKPFRLEAHFSRLQSSLDALGIRNPCSPSRWAELVHGLVAANEGGDMGIYIEITRGTGRGRDFMPPPGLNPTVFGFCWRLSKTPFEQIERGIAAVTLEDIRWLRCDIKSIALLGPVMLKMEAHHRGADEAILIRDGRLAEGSSCAVFTVKDGDIATPPASRERLPSITRMVVEDAIVALGLQLQVREIYRDEMDAADEIWIASSTREVVPVTALDNHAVGGGKAGSVWHRVFDEFQSLKRLETDSA
ncbi:MAG: D-alanine aminotransferase [Rhodanobacteraceae bacterium]|jgi:D-alanine transaminase|nr:MAG: D-alanine aminotransferase [Rhodanobacteraceae bacterium]